MAEIGTNNLKTREAWLERTLKKIPAGSIILDAGAGELQYKKFCSHLEYVSQDFAQYNGAGDGAGLQTKSWDQSRLDIVSDIASIPREDASFDAIMCVEVLEHVPEPTKAIRELSRLLKPGGWLILTAPFASMTHMAPYHFATGFNRYFYEYHLKANGFTVLEITPNAGFYGYLAQELRRVPWAVNHYSNYANSKEIGWAKKLTLKIYSAVYRGALLPFLMVLLGKYERLDTGSSEFCCFGYQVLAQKI